MKRTTAALLEAAERGLKYGRKSGEIVVDEEKRFFFSRRGKIVCGLKIADSLQMVASVKKIERIIR